MYRISKQIAMKKLQRYRKRNDKFTFQSECGVNFLFFFFFVINKQNIKIIYVCIKSRNEKHSFFQQKIIMNKYVWVLKKQSNKKTQKTKNKIIYSLNKHIQREEKQNSMSSFDDGIVNDFDTNKKQLWYEFRYKYCINI